MRGSFSASDERFVSCGTGVEFYFLPRPFFYVEGPASAMPWAPKGTPAPVRGPSEDVYP